MFQSIKYKDYESKFGQFIYCLIDSDFETEFISGRWRWFVVVDIAKEYEKRALNVPANLALYYNWIEKQDKSCNLNGLIDYDLKWSYRSKEFYDKYLVDIKKYMALT